MEAIVAIFVLQEGWRALFLFLSIIFTMSHMIEEIKGGIETGEPFWDYTTRNLGWQRLPAGVGLHLFFLFFALLLLTSWLGYAGRFDFFLCGLAGARLSDWFGSHVLLRIVWRGYNPGLVTSFLYPLEVAMLGLIVAAGASVKWQPVGFSIGFGIFAAFWVSAVLYTLSRERVAKWIVKNSGRSARN